MNKRIYLFTQYNKPAINLLLKLLTYKINFLHYNDGLDIFFIRTDLYSRWEC